MYISKFYFIILFFLFSCFNEEKKFKNLNESVSYIGMNQCAACHSEQYESFIKTGMGKSFRPALKKYSSSNFNTILYDSNLHFSYYPHWKEEDLLIQEYSVENNDTVHSLIKKVDYIIGSGHHTNSHLFENNGYLYQAPFTYYIQDSILDFPPGFENNSNSRFSRKMGLECVACHNAYPKFVLGSENKYDEIPNGIDCERCHGPGELHINQMKKGDLVDTSRYIDYSIVNPSHLSPRLQNDMCARCHLQGNAVLKENKSFFDFRPGMYLKDVMDVYLPRYENSDDAFIMASHVDRMQLSACYINSNESLSCITCHNPHISVHETSNIQFNQKCIDCHLINSCKEEQPERNRFSDNCIHCHMRTSQTIDIPHVKITDHKISIFEKDSVTMIQNSSFLGLHCVNNQQPTYESVAQAYLQQYERFESHDFYLDSAQRYIDKIDSSNKQGIYIKIYHLFLKQDYSKLIQDVESIGLDSILNFYYLNKDYSNRDAWTCYRMGEAFFKNDRFNEAEKCYRQSVKLAPYNLEFRNKYGVCLFKQNNLEFARDEFEFIINEDNNFVSAYTNLGYLNLKLLNKKEALKYYNYALKLDPNHEETLINKAELLLLDDNKKDAFLCIDKLLLINPTNEKAKSLYNYLNEI
tara:strand:- start:31972 stop:33885 length:1914 start_codon:yes stop_codon:yes gene_type:complete